MNLHASTTSKPRLLIALSAALAALAISSVAMTGIADARGGGTPVGGSESTPPSTTPAPTVNERKYARIWAKARAVDKRWAKTTSRCESGGNPDAIGGGGAYRGAFQFTKSTWRTSPKSPGGDPIAYKFKTQAVVAVALKHREGTKPWPVCG